MVIHNKVQNNLFQGMPWVEYFIGSSCRSNMQYVNGSKCMQASFLREQFAI